MAQSKLLEWVECMDPEMQLTDLSDECRSRIEDFNELLVKLGQIPDKNTLALPYVIADHGGSPSRQNTEEDENPLTVFQD